MAYGLMPVGIISAMLTYKNDAEKTLLETAWFPSLGDIDHYNTISYTSISLRAQLNDVAIPSWAIQSFTNCMYTHRCKCM